MRRVAVAVIPRPAAAIPASAIALGAVSPVFASLPAVVSACLPLLVFACLVELDGASLPVAGEATGGVASAGCVEPEGGRRLGRFRYLGRGGLVCRGLCLFVCLAGIVICRLRLFQIAEERISLGCFLVDVGFDFLRRTFESLNLSFLAFEAALVAVKRRFARLFLQFCRHDFGAQLFNSFAGRLVAECLKCL